MNEVETQLNQALSALSMITADGLIDNLTNMQVLAISKAEYIILKVAEEIEKATA